MRLTTLERLAGRSPYHDKSSSAGRIEEHGTWLSALLIVGRARGPGYLVGEHLAVLVFGQESWPVDDGRRIKIAAVACRQILG